MKLINYFPFIFLGLIISVSYSFTTLVVNNKISIPNFNSNDGGLIFWICGVGGSFLFILLLNKWYKSNSQKFGDVIRQ